MQWQTAGIRRVVKRRMKRGVRAPVELLQRGSPPKPSSSSLHDLGDLDERGIPAVSSLSRPQPVALIGASPAWSASRIRTRPGLELEARGGHD